MEARIRRRADSLVQLLALVMAHLDIFQATPLGTRLVAALQQAVQKVRSLFVTYSDNAAASHEHTVERTKARSAVLTTVRTIRRSGLLFSMDGGPAEERFPRVFSMNDRDLVSEARSIYAKAQSAAADLTARGLPSTVLEQFPTQIDALEQRLDGQGTAVDMHTAAKKAAMEAIRGTRSIVLGLEAILLNAPGVDTLTIEQWKAARRIGPAAKTAKPEQPPAAPAAAGTKGAA
ncbi:MAG TPA: hypothetical protein VEU08_18945 [Vicinamibacterales bacterium]|nr:hypothetical protein [Vicinamibacterales bacterium]